MISSFCAPSLIYLIFGLTQVCLDVYQGYYNMAFMKIIVTTIFTLLLNAMCLSNMSVLAWMIIAIPFILMSVVISMLLFVFGLNPKTGRVSNNINGVSYNDLYDISYQKIKNDFENEREKYDEDERENLDAREYQLLYGNDDDINNKSDLTKNELIYLWNNRCSGNDEETSRIFLNSDYLENILGENINEDNNIYDLKQIKITGKKLKFKIGNDIYIREILFYPDNRVTFNSENGFYFINGNSLKINNNIRFVFKESSINVGDTFDVYDNNEKINETIKVISFENI